MGNVMPSASRSSPTDDVGRETAKILLDIEAVNFRPHQPYVFTSGRVSPVYIDCRKLISYPKERRRVIEMAVATLEAKVGFDTIDAVAGGETAGIPYAAWIAEARALPMLYVRKKAKGFGRDAQIEGDIGQGSRVLLVEDLATDGASKINFVNALRTAGARVSDVFVVFFYDIYRGTLDTLNEAGIRLHHLATWRDVLEEAERGRRFSSKAISGVRGYLDDPEAWSAAHGGRKGED
jgi:orotate phosphoribosyltransferase